MTRTMKRSSLAALASLTALSLLNACQAVPLDVLIVPTAMPTAGPKGPGPATSPDPSLIPTAGPTIGPTGSPGAWNGPTATPWSGETAYPTPTPTPTADYSYPTVTPTPGSESVDSFRDADVAARRENRVLTLYKPSPDGKRSLFSYERNLEAEFRGWFYNPARHSEAAGLWLRAADGSDRNLADEPGLAQADDVYWLDDHRIAWISSEQDKLYALDLDSGARSSLYDGNQLFRLRQAQGRLYFCDTVDGRQRLFRLDPASGEQQSVELPYADYYYSVGEVHVLGPDLALVGQIKPASRAGAYPFRVMMTATPDPPIKDTYLVDLSTGRVEPLKSALDLDQAEGVSPAADGAHFLVQKAAGASVFNRAGELVLSANGQAAWLDAGRLLVLEPLGLRILRLADGAELYRASTQTSCSAAASAPAGQTLLQCAAQVNGTARSRVYAIAPNGGPLQELALNLPASGSSQIKDGRVLAHVPGPQGSSAAYELDAQSRPQAAFRLANPADPRFVFDPRTAYWYASYGDPYGSSGY